MGPCLTWCLGDVKALLSSSRHCFAALALAKITSNGRDSEVEPEVEGRVSGDSWVKVGSSGNKGSPSCECLQMCFSQAEAQTIAFWVSLYHCNISKLRPHLNDPGKHECRLLPFVKISEYSLWIDIYNMTAFQAHELAIGIQEFQLLREEWLM